MFVKICGVTDEADALLAVAMGADAVGLILAPSKRQVAFDRARDIARQLPSEVLTVGVFRDEAAGRVVELANRAGLGAVQLHGHETPAEAAWIRARVPLVIKALPAGEDLATRAAEYEVDAVLVDSPEPGSGRVFDWSAVVGLDPGTRVILAGGLTPDNVGEAIERVRPWGVDVASGVERSVGHKDPVKVRRFVNEAWAAFDRVADLEG